MNCAYRVGLVLLVNLAIVSGVVLPEGNGLTLPATAQENSDEVPSLINQGIKIYQQGYRGYYQYGSTDPDFLFKKRIEKAIAKMEKAYDLSRVAKNDLQQATALLTLGHFHQRLIESSSNTLVVFGEFDQELTDSIILRRKSLEYYDRALISAQSSNNIELEGWTKTYLASAFLMQDEQYKALEYYKEALEIAQENRLSKLEVVALNGLGRIFIAEGDFQKGLTYHQNALWAIRTLRKDAIDIKIEKTHSLLRLPIISWSISCVEKSRLVKIFSIDSNTLNQDLESVTLQYISDAYQYLEDTENAFKYANQAIEAVSESVENKALRGHSWETLAWAYHQFNQPNEQKKAFEKSSKILRGELDYKNYNPTLEFDYSGLFIIDTLNQDGLRRLDLPIPSEKSQYYSSPKRNFLIALKTSRLTGQKVGEIRSLKNLAVLYRKDKDFINALAYINEAIKIIESMREDLKSDAAKIAYFSSMQDCYHLKIDILMKLHQQQPTQGYDANAAETADESRARILRELLIQANANINKDFSPALRQQEQTLNQAIDAKEVQLAKLSSQPDNAAQLPTLNQEIAALYVQSDDLKNTIRTTNPAYANLQYPKPITLKQIQQQLDPDTLMLQYSLGEKESYLWVIGQNTLKTYILPKRTDIEPTAQAFRKELIAQLPAPKSATQLTQQILGPAAADLGKKRLVIIPDGILHTIPFAALNTPNSRNYNPLLSQHEITNLPSASTIGILRSTVATKPRGTKQLAILADPIFRKDDDRLAGKTIQANNNLDLGEQIARGRVGRDLDLDRLPFTATEAKGILALVPNQDSTSAFGFDASYDWITDPKISQYRYVHLATHGFFDNDKPALSSIILSSFDAQGNDRRAFLRFPDLFNLNLPTELVVLSACETGLGNNVPGEGLVGMTRGLMYAGALRVAVTLWNVDDQATSDLMQDFYKNLWQTKQSHVASLRAAQLKLHQKGKAPYYWAAFTLQGEWRN